MKIVLFEKDLLVFDNGNSMVSYHDPDCCEDNYADFDQLEDTALNHNFDEKTFKITPCDWGFRFGDISRTFFVPCYSDQNGYYSYEIDVEYRDKDGNTLLKIKTMCEDK